MRRRDLLVLMAVSACVRPASNAASQPPPPPTPPVIPTSGDVAFDAWRQGFLVRAMERGIPAQVLSTEITGLTPDPSVVALDGNQPELVRSPGASMGGVVSEVRIAAGREKRSTLPFWGRLETTYGVPRDILLGVWALESNFGEIQGSRDVIRSLATLAADGRRRDWAEGELIAALRMIATGAVTRAQLVGSWAGAMGQTQFMPSTYLIDAADGDGDGRKDIWASQADALASAANLLARAGWRRSEGWHREVVLPEGFDYALTDAGREPWAAWAARGVRLAPSSPRLSAADMAANASILVPAGARGPAFLALPNHYIIRRYNNSVLYALGVGLLADRIGGGGALRTPWPVDAPLSRQDRMDAQTALRAQGFDPGEPDGRIGTRSRQALRAWQTARRLPADGYLSPDMVSRLRAEPAPVPAPPAPATNALPN